MPAQWAGIPGVLVVDAALPDPQNSAGERAMVDLADALVARGERTAFLGLGRSPRDGTLLAADLRRRGVVVYEDAGPTGLHSALGSGAFDVVMVSRPGPASIAMPALASHPHLATAYWGSDHYAARLQAQAHFTAMPGRAWRLVAIAERAAWERFDLSVYPTVDEARTVDDHAGPGRGVAVPYFRLGPADLIRRPWGPDRRAGLLMVGGADHAPNLDAVEWTVNALLPALHPLGVVDRVTVVGDWPDAMRPTPADHLTFAGRVDDTTLRALHHTHLALLAPLRFGAGAKRKIVAAMGLGLPVVTTTVGARGALVRDARPDDDGISRADDPAGIAAAVERLLDGPTWWHHADAAYRRVVDVYGERSYDQAVGALLERLRASRRERHGRPTKWSAQRGHP